MTRLDEYDRDEWLEVARHLCPDWTEEQLDRRWEEFCHMPAPSEVN